VAGVLRASFQRTEVRMSDTIVAVTLLVIAVVLGLSFVAQAA
jgi:hypothetical protein